MERTRTGDLLALPGSRRRRPLVLRGARQVGKTWLVRDAARQANRTLVELNFERDPRYSRVFAASDPKQIFGELSRPSEHSSSLPRIPRSEGAPPRDLRVSREARHTGRRDLQCAGRHQRRLRQGIWRGDAPETSLVGERPKVRPSHANISTRRRTAAIVRPRRADQARTISTSMQLGIDSDLQLSSTTRAPVRIAVASR